jgi:hypothetical protein
MSFTLPSPSTLGKVYYTSQLKDANGDPIHSDLVTDDSATINAAIAAIAAAGGGKLVVDGFHAMMKPAIWCDSVEVEGIDKQVRLKRFGSLAGGEDAPIAMNKNLRKGFSSTIVPITSAAIGTADTYLTMAARTINGATVYGEGMFSAYTNADGSNAMPCNVLVSGNEPDTTVGPARYHVDVLDAYLGTPETAGRACSISNEGPIVGITVNAVDADGNDLTTALGTLTAPAHVVVKRAGVTIVEYDTAGDGLTLGDPMLFYNIGLDMTDIYGDGSDVTVTWTSSGAAVTEVMRVDTVNTGTHRLDVTRPNTKKNFQAGATVEQIRIDKNITLRNLTIDGNQSSFTMAMARTGLFANGIGTLGLLFFGVESVICDDVTVINGSQFNFFLGNCGKARIRDSEADERWMIAPAAVFNDGVHCFGPIDDLWVDSFVYLYGSDNCLAMNCGEAEMQSASWGGWNQAVTSVGDIENVVLRGCLIHMLGSACIMVLGSPNAKIKNMRIADFHAYPGDLTVPSDISYLGCVIYDGSTAGTNIDNLSIDGLTIDWDYGLVGAQIPHAMNFQGHIKSMVLSNIQVNPGASATRGRLVNIGHSGSQYGSVDNLLLSNVQWAGLDAVVNCESAASIGNMSISGVVAESVISGETAARVFSSSAGGSRSLSMGM